MLKAEDLYRGNLDGIWDPLTEQAVNVFHGLSVDIAEEYCPVDPT